MPGFSAVLVLGLIAFAFAVQHSEREYDVFTPPVPRVHLHNIQGSKVGYLNYQPSITSTDSQLIALNLAEQILGYTTTYKVKDSYESKHNKARHVYLKQTASDGREIFNADLNINVVNKKALNIGHSFFNGSTDVSSLPKSLSAIEAMNILIAFLKIDSTSHLAVITAPSGIELKHKIGGVIGANNHADVRAGYLQVDNGKRLEAVWDITLDMNLHWWNVHVSMATGAVLSVFDWVSDLNTFNIYPIGVNDPDDGERKVISDPAVINGSPLGWNDQGNGTNVLTIGNNVYAQSNPTGGSSWINNPRPNGTAALNFDFPIDFTDEPVSYVNASTSNLFAWNNYIHDIFYQYGFTEEAGNFQENNFNNGGLGNDAVQANCQDGAGVNNANFATPVDGQRPRMRMYIWTLSDPYRDGDLEQGIIIHEYAHGISIRLTGGPNNVNCLNGGEAGGMGEGWGDFFATVIRQRAEYEPADQFPMGAYSANTPGGIRKFPYTTDMTIDPETYGYINEGGYSGVHAKGEVWCGILWETYWNLVEIYGFAPDLYEGVGGNNKILQNVVDGMKLQPCNPNFVQARDAILLADELNYGSANACPLWRGFAKRGLGTGAIGGPGVVKEDFTVPPECETN